MVDAAHILIGFEGGKVPGVTRSRAEAEKLANDVCAQLKEGKVTFAELAKQHSDDKQSGQNGGELGASPPDRYVPEFADALAALKVGETTPPVATTFGFHVIRRNPDPPPPIGAAHILIPWQGAMRADPTITRTKDEAKKLADEVMAKLRGGKELAELAPEYSSCPSKAKGGDLGTFGPGQMIPEFEQAVRAAKVGELVGPVETAFGWHLIRRTQ
jgi:parvulin-like peptidyl-prolyl isomerase